MEDGKPTYDGIKEQIEAMRGEWSDEQVDSWLANVNAMEADGPMPDGGFASDETMKAILRESPEIIMIARLFEHHMGSDDGVGDYVLGLAREMAWDECMREINALGDLEDNWNGYGSEAPNESAINAAKLVLAECRSVDLWPKRIAPSAEGGIAIIFPLEDRYVMVECCNWDNPLIIVSQNFQPAMVRDYSARILELSCSFLAGIVDIDGFARLMRV